jgi:hypothetical protein
MAVNVSAQGEIALVGICDSADAEALLGRLAADPQACVDLSGCLALHAAVVQVLVASRASVRGPCADPFLQIIVEALTRAR